MITPEKIQSIVDGECSDESRVVLLQEIERHPDSWRSLALALLEEQQWSKQISKFAKNLPNDPTSQSLEDAKDHSERDQFAYRQLVGFESDRSLSVMDSAPSNNRLVNLTSAPWIPALAASLLLALGFYGGSLMQSRNTQSSGSGRDGSVASIQGDSSFELDLPPRNLLDSDLKMLVSGPNKESAEIPIYDLNATDHDLFVAREIYEVARINQRLRKEGFELEVRPEYYTGKLNDGRQLILPVKHVGLKPYGL